MILRGIKKLKNKKLIFATHNVGKIKEFEQLLSGNGIDFLDLSSFKIKDEPIENGNTFSQNAEIKIDYYFNKIKNSRVKLKPETYLMSEDSGIEINYLNGAPGVKSARYGGEINTKERNELILTKLKGVAEIERKARYVCCIKVLNFYDEVKMEFTGKLDGYISKESIDGDGFGYDPIFIPLGYNETISKLGYDLKNAISHRSVAVKKMINTIFKNE